MKKIGQRFMLFFLFDSPLQLSTISAEFAALHTAYKDQYPQWSLYATQKKLIADFWLNKVFIHFLLLFALAVLSQLFIFPHARGFGIGILIAYLITLPSIIISLYYPLFYHNFLPILESVIHEKKSLQLVPASPLSIIYKEAEIKKCKRTQFSIPALTIIFYVFSKLSSTAMIAANDDSAKLLNQLFGSDHDKLKQNLSRLHKLSALTVREKAEMRKGIEAGRAFFETLGNKKATLILDILEQKLNQ